MLRKLSILLLAASAWQAQAKVDSVQASRLGQDLTPLGGERAGNASGSIPAWDGGLATPPANYQPGMHHPDPYAADPVRYVVNAGNIEQVGAPLELYNNPANLFVAGFIGSPRMNLLKDAAAAKYGAATIGIRPEHLGVARDGGEWKGVVQIAEHLGSDTFLHIDAEGVGRITARAPGELSLTAGDRVGLTPRPDRLHRFDDNGRAVAA